MKKLLALCLCLVLCLSMLLGLSVEAFADDRIAVSEIRATSDISSIPVAGGEVRNPVITVIEGAPAYFEPITWQKRYSDEWMEVDLTGSFSPGTYRFVAEIRIDGSSGLTHVLSDQLSVTVDGVAWTLGNAGAMVYDDHSEWRARSQEFLIEEKPPLPMIVSGPKDITVAAGETAAFAVSAMYAASYQWQYYNTSSKTWDSVTNSAYGGLKTATMTVPATTGRNGLQFRCAVTNAAGTTYSSSATLTVTSASKPVITSQPQDVTTSASTATFKVTATGATSYQWQYYTGSKWDNVTNSAYSGLKTATMTVPATTGRNGMQFRCAVSNAAGTTYSNGATLTVTSASKPVITANPSNATAAAGSTATFKVTASGATSYQWQYYTGSSWANVTNSSYGGLKTATMTVPAITDRNGMQFRCAVSNAAGTTYSNGAKLTVTSASKPTITAQPSNVTTSASTATFKVTASGATSYQWQYYTGSGWANITNSSYSGLKTATRTVPTAGRSGMQFRCAVTNAAGTTYSNGATLTVASKPVITGQPQNVTANAGTTATFKVTATGATSYQWQYYNSSSKTWDNVTNSAYGGLKTATMTVPATTGRNGMQFRCAVTNAQGTTYSNGATLTVK